MIGTDIQYRGCGGIQGTHRFQLEAGQLQDIEIGDILLQHIQRRGADITAQEYLDTGPLHHGRGKAGHRTLAVGTGHGHDGGLGAACEHLYIPQQLRALFHGLAYDRLTGRHTRAQDQLVRPAQQVCIKTPGKHRDLRQQAGQAGQFRRLQAAVGHGKADVTCGEETGTGQPGLAQTDYHGVIMSAVVTHAH